MFLEFPFEYAEIDKIGILFYPIVRLELETTRGWQEYEFLVDTGADITTVPAGLLPVLGVNKNNLKAAKSLGVGGYTITSWELKLSIRFKTKPLLISANMVETRDEGMPLLLGRKDMFEEKYNLLIDSKRKVTRISENRV